MSRKERLDKAREWWESQVDRDALEWKYFMEVLSVEKTEPFIAELYLPIKEREFPAVTRLARACLEAYMYPSLDHPPDEEFVWEFPTYWKEYRAQGGVLSDDELKRYANTYPGIDRDRVPQAAFAERKDWIGVETAEVLRKWFSDNFPMARLLPGFWYLTLFMVLRVRTEGRAFRSPPPFEQEVQWQRVKEFCDSFEEGRRAVNTLFEREEAQAIADGPTPWEAALQTFPVDCNAGHGYPWLHRLRDCLVLFMFREQWQHLKSELGEPVLINLARWAYEERVGSIEGYEEDDPFRHIQDSRRL